MIEDLDGLLEDIGIDSIILVGNAFEVPDIYWMTGFRSPDEIIAIHNRGEETVVAAGFHTLDRVKTQGFIKRTYDLTELYRSLMASGKRARNHPEMVYKEILDNVFSGQVIGVPEHIPASHLLAIQGLGFDVKPVPDLLMDARATKSNREVDLIRKAGSATIDAITQILEMIKDADIGSNDNLMWSGKPLTVGVIKKALDHFLLDQGAESAEDAIIAVGTKAFDWHYLGEPDDPLKAGMPIIMDVFPRLKREMYVADVTRTVVKGNPEPKVREMFDGVLAAADAVIDALREGVTMDEVNLACYNTLKEKGFDSSRLNPSAEEGMTHGLGHGIGLAVHEKPSMYEREALYEKGHVVAIEPGVYLKKFGGVRMENDYVVRSGKPERLTPGLDDMMYL
ncbi:MAG: M24 family metallopeptidase [Candidatus Thorarchaeota archaeon]